MASSAAPPAPREPANVSEGRCSLGSPGPAHAAPLAQPMMAAHRPPVRLSLILLWSRLAPCPPGGRTAGLSRANGCARHEARRLCQCLVSTRLGTGHGLRVLPVWNALSRPRLGATYLDYDSDTGSDLISQTGTNMCVCELFGATLEASKFESHDRRDRRDRSHVDMSRTGVAFWIRI